MPDFSTLSSDSNALSYGGAAPIDQRTMAMASQQTANPTHGWLTTLAGDAGLGAVNLIDTVASSLPGVNRLLGAQKNDVNNAAIGWATRLTGSQGIQRFYESNRAGIEIASGIEGIIATDIATRKLGRAFTPLIRNFANVRGAGAILSLDAKYADAMATVRQVDTGLAASGIHGAEMWTRAMPVATADWMTGAGSTTMWSRAAAANRAQGLSFIRGAARAAGQEAVMATTLNQNDFLYSADTGQNMMWMGLGVAAGGVIGALGTGYQMRKFVNNDSLRRIRAGAMDPTGMEAARLAIADVTRSPTWLGHLQGWASDRVTAMMTSAKSAAPQGVDASSFERMATQHLELAMEEVQKITNKGLPGQQGTAFAQRDADWFRHIRSALNSDPGLVYGAEMVGAVGEGRSIRVIHDELSTALSERRDALESALHLHNAGEKVLKDNTLAAVRTELKQTKFAQELVPMVLMDRELMPLSHGEIYDNWLEPRIRGEKLGKDSSLFEAVNESTGASHGIGIETNGTLHLPTVKGAPGTLGSIDHFDALRLYRAGSALATDIARRVGDSNHQWAVPYRLVDGKPKYSWFHLDLAEEVMQRTDGRANIDWGTLTREEAKRESLIQKIKEIRDSGQGLSSQTDLAAMQKLRLRYNLPRLNSYQIGVLGTTEHPIDMVLHGATQMTDNMLDQLSLQDLKKGVADASNIGDFAQRTAADVDDFRGNSFSFQNVKEGDKLIPVKPIIVYKRNIAPTDFTPDRLSERIAAKKAAQASMLTGGQSGEITRQVFGGILSSPDYQLGSQVAGLMDTQIAASTPGVANVASQTATGATLGSFVTREWRARDNPVLLAITRLRETVDRQISGIMRSQIESTMGDQLSIIRGPRNQSSKVLLDNFHTFRPGWDLERKVIPAASSSGADVYSFVLSETQANNARFEQQFGRKMPKGQVLLDSRGKEVVVDKLALDVQSRFNKLTDIQRVEKNSLLRAQGLAEISRKEWYVPPPDLKGKFIGFVQDSAGNTVNGGTVVASSQSEFDRIVSRLHADPKSVINTVPGAVFRTRDDIQNFMSIWDRAQVGEMLNPGTTAIQGQKVDRGILAGSYHEVNRFDRSMESMRDSYAQHGNNLMQVALDDQIKAAQARSNISATVTRNADAKKVKFRSIHDYWLEAARGQTSLASEGSVVGSIYNPIERRINDVIAERTPGANRVWAAATDWLSQRMPGTDTAKSITQFNQLAEKLGNHMPFENVAELIESKALGKKPVELADITGGANRYTATWMLRMLETAQPVMNLAGIINAMPAVIRHVSAKEGESAADVAARVGHSASIFSTQDGKVFSVPDMAKIAWRGFKRGWSRTADADYAHMAANGFATQEVAEFQRQFNAIENKDTWRKWITGNPTDSNRFAQKGLVGWTSVLTDKSEDFSRSWGHFIGLEVADMAGITDKAAAHNFAHDIANKMIANYSPLNRPEVFQGAVGAPIGLFQSFMWAYWQRMFRYVETGEGRTLATQAAMQGSLFGAQTVPGFAELNSLFFKHAQGEDSPSDAMYRNFGQSGADMIMHGTLSNLPKLFGLPGMNLYSRGDVSPRLITQNPITNNPSVSAFSKIMGGIAEGLRLFSSENPDLNHQQVGEVLSNMIPNRPISGFIETALAGGYDTDGLGQVVSQSKTWADSTYRMLGLRSMDQANELEAFYGNRQNMEIKAAQTEQFNQLIRGSIRAGDYDSIPNYIGAYLEHGGDPRQVKSMIRRAYDSAVHSRGERQLNRVLNHPGKMNQAERLLNMGVGIGEEQDPATALGQNQADPTDMSIQ